MFCGHGFEIVRVLKTAYRHGIPHIVFASIQGC